MAKKINDLSNQNKLTKEQIDLFKLLNAQADEMGISIGQLEILTEAVLQAVITTTQELSFAVEDMSKQGKTSEEIVAKLKEKVSFAVKELDRMGASAEISEHIFTSLQDDMALVNEYSNSAKLNIDSLNDSLQAGKDHTDAIQQSASGVSDAIATAGSLLEPFNILTDQLVDSTDKVSAIMSDTSGIIKNIIDDTHNLSSVESERPLSLNESLNTLLDEVGTQQKLMSLLEDRTDELEKLLETEEALQNLSEDQTKELTEQITESRRRLSIQKLELGVEKAKLDVLKEMGSTYKNVVKGLSESAHAAQSSLSSFFSTLPGGDFLVNSLGIDKIGDSIDTHLNESFSNFMTQASTEGVSTFNALSTAAQGFGRGLMASLGPIGLIAAIVGAIAISFVSMETSLRDISHEMGVSHDRAKSLYKQSQQIQGSLNNRLSTLEDITGVMSEMVKLDGMTVLGNEKVLGQVSDIGKAMGYGSAQAAQFHDAISDLGASEQMAANLQLISGRAAEAAGFTSQLISEDVIDASQELSEYYVGIPQTLIKSAIETRKLGLSLKQAGRIADDILDIESSLTAQFEASAAIGRNINLDRARHLALEGDLLGMSKEIVSAVGTRAELERLSVPQRKLLAKSVGMETTEMMNMLDIQEKVATLSKEEQNLALKYQDQLKNINNMTEEQFRQELGHLSAMDETSAKWDKIKGQLAVAIMPLLEGFGDLLSALLPLLEPIVGLIKLIGILLKPLTPIIKGMIAPFKIIGSLVETIMEFFDGSVKVGTALGNTVNGLKEDFGSLEGIIFGAFGLFLSPKLFRFFGRLFPFIGKGFRGIGKIISGAFNFTGLFGKGITKSIKPAMSAAGTMAGETLTTSVAKVATKSTPKIAKAGLGIGSIFAKNMTKSTKPVFDDVTKRWRDVSTGKFVKAPKAGIMSRIFNMGNLKGIKGKVVSTVSDIVKFSSKKLSSIKGFLNIKTATSIFDTLKKKSASVFTTMSKHVSKLGIQNIISKSTDIGSKIVQSLKVAKGQIQKNLSNILSPLKDKALSVGSNILKSATKILPKLTSVTTEIAAGATKAVSSLLPKSGGVLAEGATGAVAKGAGKGVAKGAAKAGGKGILKSIAKKIPGIGALMGAGFAIQKLTEGDYLGAGMEMLSGIASTFPGLGTAVSIGIDAASIARDISRENKQTLDVAEQQNNAFNEIQNNEVGTTNDIDGSISTLHPESTTNLMPELNTSNMNMSDTNIQPLMDIPIVSPTQPQTVKMDHLAATEATTTIGRNFSESQNKTADISTTRIETLLQQLIQQNSDLMNRPAIAVIGDDTVNKLNIKQRALNAQ